jgi:hypothetical protein
VPSHSLALDHSSVVHFPVQLTPECVRGGPQNGVKLPPWAFAGVSDAEMASASIPATISGRMFILPEKIGAHRTLKTSAQLASGGFLRLSACCYACTNVWW